MADSSATLHKCYASAVEAHRAGQLDEALAHYLDVLKLDGTRAKVHNNVAAIYLKKGDVDAAKRHWTQAIEADAEFAEAHYNLAVLLAEHEGSARKAIKHVKRALALREGYVQAHHLLGNILQDLGQPEEAHLQFARAEALAVAAASTAAEPASQGVASAAAGTSLPRLDGVAVGHVQQLDAGAHGSFSATTLSLCPLVLRVDGLLSDDECARIIELARGRLKASGVTGGPGQAGTWRSSESVWVRSAQDAAVARLESRLAALAQLPEHFTAHSEDLQVVHYGAGGKFELHHDSSAMHTRHLTALYYLNDVEEGGHTAFPAASGAMSADEAGALLKRLAEGESAAELGAREAAKSIGLRVAPIRGAAVLFYNHLDDGSFDPTALHAGCEVLSGEKWCANHWVNLRPTA